MLVKWWCFLFDVCCFFCGCLCGFWIDSVEIIIIILCKLLFFVVLIIICFKWGLIGNCVNWWLIGVSLCFLLNLVLWMWNVCNFLSKWILFCIWWILGEFINGNVVILFNLSDVICKIIEVKLVCKILGLVNLGWFLKFFFEYKWI